MSKSLRLSFKGDKPEKKKKHKSSSAGGSSSSSKKKRRAEDYVSDVEEYGGDEQAWVPAVRIDDVAGPSFLYQQGPASSHPFCISFNTTLNALEAAALVPPDAHQLASSSAAKDAVALEEVEGAQIVSITTEVTPQSVHQVWVANRIEGTSSWTLRGAEGKYLGCDRFGVVKASAEARGPQEEWELVAAPPAAAAGGGGAGSQEPARLALRSAHGGYLTLDEVAGGKKVIRADADSIGESEMWQVMLQWSHRHKARYGDQLAKKLKGQEDIATSKADALDKEVKLFKSRAGTGYMPAEFSSMSAEDRKALRKAQKEGRLAEEMLDRRTKYKR
ncbi:uncharacterized protein PSFLO_03577 [Pseudozyma flocculosa]|uniref:FRG1-like family-domain-containing protein n=1 Tax=Pseudozyma flocculosa TaxID=84751 RepID=A0A5C3F205_9BASI|nr:uncharacterized protein PSFLO_03577 [Pseudozyma flocculosa]